MTISLVPLCWLFVLALLHASFAYVFSRIKRGMMTVATYPKDVLRVIRGCIRRNQKGKQRKISAVEHVAQKTLIFSLQQTTLLVEVPSYRSLVGPQLSKHPTVCAEY